MTKTAIFPGSFDPWHAGHEDTVKKALSVFDRVIVARGINPGKPVPGPFELKPPNDIAVHLTVVDFHGFLHEAIPEIEKEHGPISAVIRGLRNGADLQYEQNQMYWYEDLGLKIPIVFFLTDRKLSHISSSALRAIRAIAQKRSDKVAPLQS